jgi:hypothetical protein
VMALCNGVLCGLVAVTPGCGVMDVWAAIIVAVLGAGLFLLLDWLMLRRGKGRTPPFCFQTERRILFLKDAAPGCLMGVCWR